MTAKVDWDADQYLRFEDERTRPSLDLLQGVRLTAPARCIDLGCGPGNSTELVAARFPDAEVTGLDSSADMIEKARKRLPRLSFVQADLAGWAPEERYDLIFANAVLQWLQANWPSWVKAVPVETNPIGLGPADLPHYAAAAIGAAFVCVAGYVLKRRPADQPG